MISHTFSGAKNDNPFKTAGLQSNRIHISHLCKLVFSVILGLNPNRSLEYKPIIF